MEDDNEITNYWSKLLLFLIIVFFGYITYYKFMVFDKKVPTDNKVKETEKNNENIVDPGIDDVHYADDTGEDINIGEQETDTSIDNVKNYLKSKYTEILGYQDISNFEKIESKEDTYKFNNIYFNIIIKEGMAVSGETPTFKILDTDFNVIDSSNRIFKSNDIIYYSESECDFDIKVPDKVKDSESHMVNIIYKIDTKTGEKTFMDYVKYDGAQVCEETKNINERTNNNTNKSTDSEYDSIASYIEKNKDKWWGLGFLADRDNTFAIDTNSINETKCDGNSFTLTNNGLNVEAKCVKNREDDYGDDYIYNITTKNNKVISVYNGVYSCGTRKLYSNNNYIIEYYSGCSINGQKMTIYNVNDGSKVYYDYEYNEDSDASNPYLATYTFVKKSDENGLSHGVSISKNKLYYVLADNVANKKAYTGNTKCRLMMVDLTNSTFKEIEVDSTDCYYYSRYS